MSGLQEAHHHPRGANHESVATAEPLRHPQGNDCAKDIDGSENDLRHIAVADSRGGKDSGAKVEEEVGTRELLAGLENDAENGAVQHARGGEDFAQPELVGASALLVEIVLDIGELVVDALGVGREAGQLGDGDARAVNAAAAAVVARTLGHEQDGGTENESPGKGQAVGDAPRGAVRLGLGAPVDHLGGPDAQGDEELVRGDDDAADDGGSTLGLVHGHDDGQGADAHAADQSPDGELGPVVRGGYLDDGADAGEEGGGRNGQPAADEVGHFARNQRADEGADADQSYNGALPGGAEVVGSIELPFAKSLLEVLHEEEAGYLTAAAC